MLCHNARAIALISFILLFFAVLAYGPSVYAKMKVLEDEYLSQVEGEAGVTLGLNVTARVVADTLKISNSDGQYIQASPFYIDNGSGGNLSISSVVDQDVGTSGGHTWLQMDTPTILGMRVYAPSLTVSSSTGTYTLGNLSILGIYMGSSVSSVNGTSITPSYVMGGTPFMRIGTSSSAMGVSIYSEQALYIDNILWEYSTSSNVKFNGIYMYAANTNIANSSYSSWPTLTGNAIIGYNGSAVDYATVNVGSGGASGTILQLNVPNSSSMRIRKVTIGSDDFGPIAADNQNFYVLRITIRNLNSGGY